MAYNAIAQLEHDLASNSDSDASRSPSPRDHTFQPLQDADHLGHLETARTTDTAGLGLGSLIRSMTSTSYDVVEDDDYDADHREDPHTVPPPDTAVARHASPPPPLRSAPSDTPVPLSHPIPDLQSLQGAYSGNVERLEQSAERLTSSTADIASEIRKMDKEQKRRSCSSASNSVNLRNGAFSPSVIASSHGSTKSTRQRSVSGGSRLAQVSEPGHDEEPHFVDPPASLPMIPAPPQVYSQTSEIYHGQYDGQSAASELERPSSVASCDTYQQARTLFTDFDGVHFEPRDSEHPRRQLSLSQSPLAGSPASFNEPQRGENMVYYPAPVPRLLNLPPKLSRKSHTEREKRRTQVIKSIAAADEKSAQPLTEPDHDQIGGKSKGRRHSTVPSQLRASVFFDPPSTTLDIQVKQDSAVATLESILDASANAPVSAFTDHPYAGQVGSYVYGKSKRTTSIKKAAQRDSQHPGEHEHEGQDDSHGTSLGHSSIKSQGKHEQERSDDSESKGESTNDDDEEEEEEEEEKEEAEEDYVGPPNTLLAELQLRKQELKQRQRTVVPKPTQGMQHTLLEMDAMAQKQSEKRRRRPVTLAWDTRDTADDDDVPLAMLYPEKNNAEDQDHPVGLMERRHLEENEPLSTRRARLRGEPVPKKRPTTVYTSHVLEPTPRAEESGDEVETLAERLRRLRGQDPTESDFAHDLLAEIDNRAGVVPKETTAPIENETLAQRRSRLQKESSSHPAPARNPRERRSMAALPQVRPTHVSRQSSYDALHRPNMIPQYGHRMSMQFPTGYQMPMGNPMAQPSYGMMHQSSPYQRNSMMGMNGMTYTMPYSCGPAMTRPPVDPNQQDMIDRWRQSIR
ncbi:hypothetical protein N7512_002535 [Penicillium capsulatum]|nr:hypothetical protein N7512_002535 [Penicillium capsulatum]